MCGPHGATEEVDRRNLDAWALPQGESHWKLTVLISGRGGICTHSCPHGSRAEDQCVSSNLRTEWTQERDKYLVPYGDDG